MTIHEPEPIDPEAIARLAAEAVLRGLPDHAADIAELREELAQLREAPARRPAADPEVAALREELAQQLQQLGAAWDDTLAELGRQQRGLAGKLTEIEHQQQQQDLGADVAELGRQLRDLAGKLTEIEHQQQQQDLGADVAELGRQLRDLAGTVAVELQDRAGALITFREQLLSDLKLAQLERRI